jgi:hypothetical protein
MVAVTQDTAANTALQQQQLLARCRGVLANISAGNQATAPTVSKTALGCGFNRSTQHIG